MVNTAIELISSFSFLKRGIVESLASKTNKKPDLCVKDKMPIRPENRARYPKNWKEIVARVRKRSGGRCEFIIDNYGGVYSRQPDPQKLPSWRCKAKNKRPHPITKSIVVLTVAHLDHTPENCSMENLRDACQRCHNRYDAPTRRAGIKQRARAKQAISELPL